MSTSRKIKLYLLMVLSVVLTIVAWSRSWADYSKEPLVDIAFMSHEDEETLLTTTSWSVYSRMDNGHKRRFYDSRDINVSHKLQKRLERLLPSRSGTQWSKVVDNAQVKSRHSTSNINVRSNLENINVKKLLNNTIGANVPNNLDQNYKSLLKNNAIGRNVSNTFLIDEAELVRRLSEIPYKIMFPSRSLARFLVSLKRPMVVEKYDNKLIYQPHSQCQGHPVLIIVPSHPRDSDMRKAIRQSWGKAAKENQWPGKPLLLSFTLVFVLGLSEYSNRQMNLRAEEYNSTQAGQSGAILEELTAPVGICEQEKMFDDIVQFHMVDSYRNLTLKMILSFKWALSSCKEVLYILKIDQDIFPNIPLLLAFLKHRVASGFPAIYGHIYSGGKVQRRGRWAVPSDILPLSKYPPYALGPAYIITRKAAQVVSRLSPYFRYVSVEDAFITGVVASVGSVQRIHVTGFTNPEEERPDATLCDLVMDRAYYTAKMTDVLHKKTREELDKWDLKQKCNQRNESGVYHLE